MTARPILYLMQRGPLVKVGVTADVRRRRLEIGGRPKVLQTWALGSNAGPVEGVSKDLLWPYAAGNGLEWFRVSPDKARKAIREALQIVLRGETKRFSRRHSEERKRLRRETREDIGRIGAFLAAHINPNAPRPLADLLLRLEITDKKMSLRKIADTFKVSPGTIRNHTGGPTRTRKKA